MKIQILTIGSRGDVQPYVALGVGLKRAGYDVQICTAEMFREFVEEQGLGFAALPNDLPALLGAETGKKAIEDLQGMIGWFRVTVRLIRTVKPIFRELLTSSWEASRDFSPDLLIYNSKMPGVHIAEKLGIPCVLGIPFPQLVPTKEMPTLGMPDISFFNLHSYRIVRLVMGMYGGFINDFRTKTLGLPKASRFPGLHHMANGVAVPVFHAFSRHIVERPNDWPEGSIITGYWFMKDPSEPSGKLVDFLKNGEPPVYVGFGSMSGRKAEATTRVVVEALEKARVRGIIASGWGGLDPKDLPDSILGIKGAPHEWLFPRVSAVVHHGGAGTTAAGLRAGKPTVICPFFGDQPFWGERVHQLGIGPKPIPQRKLSVDRLSSAICEAVTNQGMRDKAEEIGRLIREEDGIAAAVSAVRRMLSIEEK